MKRQSVKLISSKAVWTIFLIALSITPSATAQQDVAQAQTESTFVRESRITSDFSNVKATIFEYLKRYQPNEILLVVDVDNTMLAMNQDLGSDQWFNWQTGLLKSDPTSADLVAGDFPGLLDVQGLLFAMSGMHPPEPELPKMVGAILEQGVQTIVLTSRGPAFRDATERELNKNGYDFAKNAFAIQEKRGPFLPFDPNDPEAHGLSAEIVDSIKSRLSPVSYSNGIFLTAGQNKGYMLRTLLDRRVRREGDAENFKAIVFVDDHEKHTVRMHEAHEGFDLDLSTFRYSREDGNVSNFKNSSKKHVVHDWNRLREFIDRVLVK